MPRFTERRKPCPGVNLGCSACCSCNMNLVCCIPEKHSKKVFRRAARTSGPEEAGQKLPNEIQSKTMWHRIWIIRIRIEWWTPFDGTWNIITRNVLLSPLGRQTMHGAWPRLTMNPGAHLAEGLFCWQTERRDFFALFDGPKNSSFRSKLKCSLAANSRHAPFRDDSCR